MVLTKNYNENVIKKSAITVTLTAMLAAILVLGKLSLAVVPNVEIVTLCVILFAAVFPFRMSFTAVIVFCLLDPLIYGFRLDVLLQYLIHYPTMCTAAFFVEKFSGRNKWLNYVCIMILQAVFAVAFWLESPLLYTMMYGFPFKIYATLGVPFFAANIIGNTIALGLLYFPLRIFFKNQTKKLFRKNLKRELPIVFASDKCYNQKKKIGEYMVDFPLLLKLLNLDDDIDDDLRSEIQAAQEEFWQVADFTFMNKEIELDAIKSEEELYKKLKTLGADRILVGACTLGENVDKIISDANASYDFTKMMVFGVLANYIVSKMHCEQMEEIRAIALDAGYYFTDEFAPGTTVPLSVQTELFNILFNSNDEISACGNTENCRKIFSQGAKNNRNESYIDAEKNEKVWSTDIENSQNECFSASLNEKTDGLQIQDKLNEISAPDSGIKPLTDTRELVSDILKTDFSVRLTEDLLMYPKKSLSYIYGLTKNKINGKIGHDCAICHAKNCPNRKNKQDKARITVKYKSHTDYIDAEKGANLLSVLLNYGYAIASPCGGRGTCGKCKIRVLTGGGTLSEQEKKYFTKKELKEGFRLACNITINEPIEVLIEKTSGDIFIAGDISVTGKFAAAGELLAVLDIGTTTVVLALIDSKTKDVVDIVNANNPQSKFGADVISRIEYARGGGAEKLHSGIIACVNGLFEKLIAKYGKFTVEKLTVSANTTMLHFFMNRDATGMAMYPYIPAFLEKITESGAEIGIDYAKTVETLEGLSAFVGADIMSGVYYLGKPKKGKWNLLVDLGTNAEIALFSDSKMYCTAAASGPAFEGANISFGMSATDGAISDVSVENGKPICKTIGNAEAVGICGTGLVDGVCAMRRLGEVDEDGGMDKDIFYLDGKIGLTQKDIREFQVAKSAVRSGIDLLLKNYNVKAEDLNQVCIAGGFAKNINVDNAVYCGLLPAALREKTVAVGNSGLLGAIKVTLDQGNYSEIVATGEYVDMACDSSFFDLFMDNMAL